MSLDYTIYIPTWGREIIETVKQFTIPMLNNTVIVTTSDWKDKIILPQNNQIKLVTFGSNKGALYAKQNILDFVKQNTTSKVLILLDDDLRFVYHNGILEEGRKRFKRTKPQELEDCFTDMVNRIQSEPDLGFISFSTPYFNRSKDKIEECCFPNASFIINLEVQKKTGAKFIGHGLQTREDALFALTTWIAGYRSETYTCHAVENSGRSDVGGESLVNPIDGKLLEGRIQRGARTEQAHKKLKELFPKYTTLYEKKNNRMKEVGTTVEIKIYGKKAYKENKHKVK